jgi:hypothetical protein
VQDQLGDRSGQRTRGNYQDDNRAYSAADVNLAARVVYAESNAPVYYNSAPNSLDAVSDVILNRVNNPSYGAWDTLQDVIKDGGFQATNGNNLLFNGSDPTKNDLSKLDEIHCDALNGSIASIVSQIQGGTRYDFTQFVASWYKKRPKRAVIKGGNAFWCAVIDQKTGAVGPCK